MSQEGSIRTRREECRAESPEDDEREGDHQRRLPPHAVSHPPYRELPDDGAQEARRGEDGRGPSGNRMLEPDGFWVWGLRVEFVVWIRSGITLWLVKSNLMSWTTYPMLQML